MTVDPIHVDFEYGDLKEVSVGCGKMLYPDVARVPWGDEAVKVLPKSEAEKLLARSGRMLATCRSMR